MKPHPFEKACQLLVQGDCTAAVAEARRVHRRTQGATSDWALASVLINASDFTRKLKLAREGKKILEGLPSKLIEANADQYYYNLGIACASIGRHEKGVGAARRPSFAAAVSHYDQSLQSSAHPDTRANLANALLAQGRYIEALDELDDLLASQPQHYNAWGYRGTAFLGIDGWLNNSHAGILQAALLSYRKAVEFAKNDPIVAQTFARRARQLEARVRPPADLEQAPMRDDVDWIWRNRLALNPCPICKMDSPDAFDLYPLPGVLKSPKRRPPTDDLFVVVNSILATFGTARWQLWAADSPDVPLPTDHIIQHTGTAGCLVDLRLGLRMAAMTGFYRVLGQVASALNNCLSLKHAPHRVKFDNVWGRPGSHGLPSTPAQLNPGIRRRRNAPLSALYYLSASLEQGRGRYQHLRVLRNDIEHQLAAPFSQREATRTRYYKPFTPVELSRDVYTIGRLARSAIWYLCAAFLSEERRRVHSAQRAGHILGKGSQTPVARR